MAHIPELPTLSPPQKRRLSFSSFSPDPPKRLKQSYERHHSLKHRTQVRAPGEPALLQQDAVDQLLVGSIKAVCEEQAQNLDVEEPVIESLALEAFRNAVEEFMMKLSATVRRSMLAARRSMPIACDFETAFHVLNVPRPYDQILPYRTNPVTNPPLLPTPPPDDVFHNCAELPTAVLGPELSGEVEKKRDLFIPRSFPPLPSKHTYKDTPVFPTRETDPRRIRELATEEGKLGEEALRKLAGAVKIEATFDQDSPVAPAIGRKPSARQRQATSVEGAFEEAMRDLLKEERGEAGDTFEIGPVVNSEKRLWRQDQLPSRLALPQSTSSVPVAAAGHTLSEKARGKQPAI